MLACLCGGTRRVISTIEEGPAAQKILRHLGLPDTVPPPTLARLDQAELWPTSPAADHHRNAPAVNDVQRSPLPFGT